MPMESLLQKIWAEILNISMESIRRDDSFLSLGGDLIAAIHLVNTARDDGIVLHAKDIFDDARLLAVAASAKGVDCAKDSIPELLPFDQVDKATQKWAVGESLAAQLQLSGNQIVEDAYDCTNLQEGLMALSLMYPGSYTAKYVYRLSDQVDIDRFRSAWEETIDLCGTLRTRIALFDGNCVQVVVKNDQLWDDTSNSLKAAIERTTALRMSYDTKLSQFTITKDEDGNNYFLWTIHHAIYDGWTVPLLLQTFYQAYQDRDPFVPCSSDDVCFGATISGRQASVDGLLNVAGPTVATVPIRVRMDRKQQNISKLSPEAKLACDFSSLLLVQPMKQFTEDSEMASIMAIADTGLDAQETLAQNYYTYPLVIQGHIYSDHVEFVNDSFLRIGGDSIGAIQLVSLAREAGIHLQINQIFENSRLSHLACVAREIEGTEDKLEENIPPFGLLSQSMKASVTDSSRCGEYGLEENNVIEDALPCTKLQEGLMAIAAKQQGSYLVKNLFKIPSHVNIERFKTAWEQIIASCSNLHTKIVLVDNIPIQIQLKANTTWKTVNSTLESYRASCKDIVVGYSSAFCHHCLFEDDGEHYFALNMHHAVFDGWSLSLIFQTLSAAYEGTELPGLLPYSKFVKYVNRISNEDSVEYWETQLNGAKPAALPPQQTTQNAKQATAVLEQRIYVPRTENSTITKATILRAAWSIILARYSDTDDICFGSVVSGRNASIEQFLEGIQSQASKMVPYEQFGIQNIAKIDEHTKVACNFSSLMIVQPAKQMGLIADENDAPILEHAAGNEDLEAQYARFVKYTMDLQHDTTSAYWLEQLHDAKRASFPASISETTAVSGVTRYVSKKVDFSNLSRTSCFGASVSGRNADLIGADSMPGVMLATVPIRVQLDKSQAVSEYLRNIQAQSTKMVEIVLMYNTARMSRSQAVALSEQFNHVIQQLLSRGQQPLSEVSVAGPWDLQQAIGWNSADISPIDDCLHSLVSNQARCRPNHEAIYSTGGSMTYAKPDLLSSQLAVVLREKSVGSDVFVPICLEKSVWTIVAMLGILKAGGAFVPLDPSHPVARRQALVDAIGAQVLRVSSSLAREYTTIKNTAKPTKAAYLLYTSGSTGLPKGVVVEHQGVCTSLIGEHKAFNTNENSRWFQVANYVFDACITEIFAALTAGGTVCVPTETERMHHTAKFIMDAQVNIALLTPTVVKTLTPDSVPSLKTLIFGGEAASKDILQTWYGRLDLRNAYGPAEACILRRRFAHHYWVVDSENDQKLAPVGCVAELLVQGPALARGYFADEEKTKCSSLEDVKWLPAERSKFCRFYKTGDLVRYIEDGTLEYLGRKDTQIKIRGQRIEVGEVEHQVKKLEKNIKHVAVDIVNKESLVAFICFRRETSGDAAKENIEFQAKDNEMEDLCSQLWANMSHVLPQYMLPSYAIPVAQMPHNSASKLDRKLLLQAVAQLSTGELAHYFSGQRTIFRNCTNDVELWIRSQWACVLNLPAESISADDNFDQLGGDSIRIVTLAKSILSEYCVNLGLSILNSKHTTISSMAKFVESGGDVASDQGPETNLMHRIEALTKGIYASQLKNLINRPIVKLSDRSTVFLTGATGFLGTEFLRQLLRNFYVKSVITAKWWRKNDVKKIGVWAGDLGKSQLGLNASQWERLSGMSKSHSKMDAIVHNGAVVNWNADYDNLRAANVDSTVELLNITTASPAHPIFVFVPNSACEGVIQNALNNSPAKQNRLSIVKPGRIIGSQSNGVANVDDLIWRVVSGAAAIHSYPAEPAGNWMYIADVGSVASTVLDQVLEEDPIRPFIHVTGAMPTTVFWKLINETLSVRYKPVSWEEWKETALATMNEIGDKHPVWPVQHFLGALGVPRLAKELATESLEYEQWHAEVKKNVQYLTSIGFIASSVRELGSMKDGALK
ncbi:hypothetical protein MKX08_005729 [Trichoderma sp. CBMAI-0020]|nr:hypothetical protein MKX08_005729 [Trichoderma sp. CBMAI-0020]